MKLFVYVLIYKLNSSEKNIAKGVENVVLTRVLYLTAV